MAANAETPVRPARPTRKRASRPTAAAEGPRTALLAALGRLDALVGCAVAQQARRLGPASLSDPWLGMHLEPASVERLIAEQAHRPLGVALADATAGDSATTQSGEPVDVAGLLGAALRQVDGLPGFADALGLDDLDLAILLIALAPDLDLRYERLYGYLQDDLTRRRPCADLMANLLATDPAARLRVLDRLSRRAPLRLHGLLLDVGDGARPALAGDQAVDPIWRAWLVRADIRDALPAGCRLAETGPLADLLVIDADTAALLERACGGANHMPLRLALEGEHGAGKLAAAAAVARRLGLQMLVLDLRDAATAAELAGAVERAARVGCLFGALLYLHGIGTLASRDPQLVRALLQALSDAPCHLATSAVRALPAAHATVLPLLRIALRFPDAQQRESIWVRALGPAAAAALPASSLAALAQRFTLSAAQIGQAAAEARLMALHQGDGLPGYVHLAAAVRRQCGGELAQMALRVLPRAGFDNLVVAPEVRAQLAELCARVSTRETVGRDWADASVHARVPGVTALFVGPSGTGKTLSAEAVARELGLDLYRIDLAGIVSKYIGETEKNLDRVFAAAVHANAVLFFDEADALFGKRSEVKDAHDRYANIEVAYLLQKMEQFDGLAILATNLKQNLDEAFARRLTFTVNFPFPEAAERQLLWEQLWPARAPRAADVDLAWFAHEFRLSGGNIRNAVVAAAHLAAADGTAIDRGHLLHATRREFQKLGKTIAHPLAVPRPAPAREARA